MKYSHVILILLLGYLHLAASSPAKPNIVPLMADDIGHECVTANGGKSYQISRLDCIASVGIRFEQCRSQPLCTPTGVQLITGKYNIRNYLNFDTLPRTETIFSQLLKTAGYITGIYGKWQLAAERDSALEIRFDKSLLWQQTRRPPRYANPSLELTGEGQEYPKGNYGPPPINYFAPDLQTRHKAKPIFMSYPTILPHAPCQPTPDSPDTNSRLQDEKLNHESENCPAMLNYMDIVVGRLDAKLAERVKWLFNLPGEELYDLQSNPNERKNLAALPHPMADIKARLQSQPDSSMIHQVDQGIATE